MDIEQIQKLCLSWPGVTEDVKWGNDLCFCIGEKMFCVTGMVQPLMVSFKCSNEDFEELCEREDIVPAPYLARNKWVQVQRPSALTKKEWVQYIKKSYELIAAKLSLKQRKQLGLIK
ncbi:MAG TPA: MmcQ/YjbR family DNA-binding protein [Chitinophagaceae bacterium]|nr:MmcQ/YjbR family DNA-binding protein [Chitinophagaceae bacterium]